MGQLNHEPQIQHFSHVHPLNLTHTNQQPPLPCAGCKLQSSGWMYTCTPCNFTLHVSCSHMPHLITHPSHPAHHPLSLLPSPPYPGGLFTCDACSRHSHGGFIYHCRVCDFDLHLLCATKPLFLSHHSHSHQLKLTFSPPYQTKGFSCDICRGVGSNHWLYRCGSCHFDAHLDCATAPPPPQTAATAVVAQSQSQHFFARANNNKPNYMNNNNNYQYQHQYQYQQGPNNSAANCLVNAAVQGFVEGAAQQVGQTVVQGIVANCGSAGAGGEFAPPPVIDVGSSVVNGVFGESETQK